MTDRDEFSDGLVRTTHVLSMLESLEALAPRLAPQVYPRGMAVHTLEWHARSPSRQQALAKALSSRAPQEGPSGCWVCGDKCPSPSPDLLFRYDATASALVLGSVSLVCAMCQAVRGLCSSYGALGAAASLLPSLAGHFARVNGSPESTAASSLQQVVALCAAISVLLSSLPSRPSLLDSSRRPFPSPLTPELFSPILDSLLSSKSSSSSSSSASTLTISTNQPNPTTELISAPKSSPPKSSSTRRIPKKTRR